MRLFLFSFALVLCSVFTSCSDNEFQEQEETFFLTPTLTADFDSLKQTRTQINGESGDVEWDANDELLVFVHEKGMAPKTTAEWLSCRYKFVTDEVLCKDNKFRQETASGKMLKLNPNKEYEWYVMSPYTETVTSPVGHGSFSLDNQTLNFASNTAHLGAKDIMTCVNHSVKAEDNILLSLKHLTTLMMFRVHNKLDIDVIPRQMEFESKGNPSATMGGTYAVDFEKGLSPIAPTTQFSLSFSNAPVVKAGTSFDVYAIMNPFSLHVGEQFHIRVITDKSNTLQTSTMRKEVNFKAGTINRANVKITPSSINSDINPWENQGEIDGEIQLN